MVEFLRIRRLFVELPLSGAGTGTGTGAISLDKEKTDGEN